MKTRAKPFPAWPAFDEADVEAVAEVLRSGRVDARDARHGPALEAAFAAMLGRRHALAVPNGTLALELALVAFGVGPGDEVVTPARSFVASAACAVARGARPVFADVDPDAQTLTAETIAAALTPRTKAVVAVHLGGTPCPMDAIMALAEARGLVVIEDCAQAQGAAFRDRPVGAWGHAAAFSFCQDKIMTTGGEGGLLALDDPAAWRRAFAWRDHGRPPDAGAPTEPPGAFRWRCESFGTNWRMSELQAAVGLSQLPRVPAWLEARRGNASALRRALAGLPGLRLATAPAGGLEAPYRVYAFVRPEALAPGWSRDRVLAALLAAGVPAGVGSCPELYLEAAFPPEWRPRERLPVAKALGETSLAFQVHPGLSPEDMRAMAEAVAGTMRAATRR